MGGHGGLNILPQKSWNVYNYDNREKVKRDEEAAAKEEQLKLEQQRKRDAEFRLQRLRSVRGLPPLTEPEEPKKSNHINLFEGIKIFDVVETEERPKKKKKKEEAVRVVTAEDEKYRLGYGLAGKGVKLPWYMAKKSDDVDGESSGNVKEGRVETKKRKKTVEELREERLQRERKEKERERVLLREMSRRDGGFSRR